jgi:hypothetical protein
MKIIALLQDGLGHLHLVAMRAPDLLRRELSAQTGSAELLWCAVPPSGQGAATVVVVALQRLGVSGVDGLTAVPLGRIVKSLTDLCVAEPRRDARLRQLRSGLSKIARRLRRLAVFPALLGPLAQRRSTP